MTRQEIIQGVKNLDIVRRSNSTMSGLKIIVNALKDYADEAKKIDKELSDYLFVQADILNNAAQQGVHWTAQDCALWIFQ